MQGALSCVPLSSTPTIRGATSDQDGSRSARVQLLAQVRQLALRFARMGGVARFIGAERQCPLRSVPARAEVSPNVAKLILSRSLGTGFLGTLILMRNNDPHWYRLSISVSEST